VNETVITVLITAAIAVFVNGHVSKSVHLDRIVNKSDPRRKSLHRIVAVQFVNRSIKSRLTSHVYDRLIGRCLHFSSARVIRKFSHASMFTRILIKK